MLSTCISSSIFMKDAPWYRNTWLAQLFFIWIIVLRLLALVNYNLYTIDGLCSKSVHKSVQLTMEHFLFPHQLTPIKCYSGGSNNNWWYSHTSLFGYLFGVKKVIFYLQCTHQSYSLVSWKEISHCILRVLDTTERW